MSWAEVRELTIDQLDVELGVTESRPASVADLGKAQRQKQFEIFDKVCERNHLSRERLARMPLGIVAAYVSEVLPKPIKETPTLAAAVAQYAKA